MTAAALASLTVLVVEDNFIQQQGIALILCNAGYCVATAHSGSEALDYLQSNPRPDLILLDMILPGKDGWWFLHSRNRDVDIKDIPVVIMTGVGVASPEWAISLGAQGFLPKPFDRAPLLAEIRRCIGCD